MFGTCEGGGGGVSWYLQTNRELVHQPGAWRLYFWKWVGLPEAIGVYVFSHNYHACHIHQSAYTPNTAIGVYFFSHNYHTCHIHQSNPFPIQARDFQPDLPRAGVPWALVPGSANDERLCEGSRLILGCSDMDHESCVLAAGVASGDVWRQLL